jgi:AcrR family transcriptional regulator
MSIPAGPARGAVTAGSAPRAVTEDTSPVPTKGPGRNRLLTQELLARAAFDLVDEQGPTALTINRLASKLGVSPMTLYGYADSKDAIIAMLPERLLADLPSVRRDQPWPTVLEETFVLMYRRFIDHRHVTQLITNGAVFVRAQAQVIEGLLECLEEAGFSQEDAFALQRTLATYTIGFAFFAIAEHVAGDSPRSRTNWTEQLNPDEFPRIARASSLLAANVDESQYLRGLRRILGNFEPQ